MISLASASAIAPPRFCWNFVVVPVVGGGLSDGLSDGDFALDAAATNSAPNLEPKVGLTEGSLDGDSHAEFGPHHI